MCPSAFVQKEAIKPKKSPPSKIEDILFSRIENLSGSIGASPLFIDLRHLPDSIACSTGEHIWDALSRKGTSVGLTVVPVTGFYGKGSAHQAMVAEVVRSFGYGVATRLFRRDLERQSLSKDISTLLKMLKTGVEQADLLIDLELVGEDVHSISSIIEQIPQVNDWRTLTIIGGSFPLDLRHLKSNGTYELFRYGFKVWKNELRQLMQSLHGRTPSFGDYTIQHPVYREPVTLPHVSASIRYSAPESWIVFRGEWIGKKNGAGSAQYPAEAQLLMERPEYSGEDFSFGDRFVAEKARSGSDHPGNAAQWLLAGINHHITLTAETIRTISEPAKATEVAVPVASAVTK